MEEQSNLLRILTVLGLGAGTIALTMNMCAMDRWEKQLIRTQDQLSELDKTVAAVSAGGAIGRPSGSASGECTPGEPLSQAVGWGKRRAPILCVEGRTPGAPHTIGGKEAFSGKHQGDSYVNRRSSPPKNLNYYASNEGDASRISGETLGRLIALNPRSPSEVVPALATSWSVSADKLTYTFKLRKGVLHADGRPFSAEDVKFTFEVMRDPAVKADHLRSFYEDVESVESPDAHTVVVKYRKKYWAGLYAFGYDLRILNKGWYEEQIPQYAKDLGIEEFATTPGSPGFGEVFNKIRIPCPGTGPYYMPGREYTPEEGVKLVQNPFSWQIQVNPSKYNFEEYTWVYISDEVAAFEEFRKGAFDVSVVDHQQWDDELATDETIANIAEYYVYDHIGIGHSAITWNNRRAPFDDPRVRRAMTQSLDRAWMLKEIERGRGEIAVCNSKRIFPTYSPELEPLPFDLEEAGRLLDAAGWTDTDGDGVRDRDGKPLEFELKVGSPRPFYTQTAGLLADSCKKLGVRMNLRTLEWSTFIQDYMDRNFDGAVLYHSFPSPFIDPYSAFHSSQDIPGGGNGPGWHNDRVDKLLAEMREEFDEQKRIAMFHEFNRIFQQEQPRTLLLEGKVGVLVNNRFEEVEVLPTGLRPDEWWVKPENVKYK
ncbi:MAG: peptide/nickel transport system substrate-binding protein [Myxococcota bacterium]|jgi:peptide/nickel transport system substrate-binding protein